MRRSIEFTLFVFFAAALAAVPAFAQDWVGRSRMEGRVVSAETGDPIAGATIELSVADASEAPENQVTDKKGRWSLSGLRGGTWEVIARAEGYTANREFVEVSATGGRFRSMIKLEDIPEEEKQRQKLVVAAGVATEGNELLQAGDYAQARAKYEEALELARDEDKAQLYLAIAETHSIEESHEEAIEILEKAVAETGDDTKLLTLLVAELAAVGDEEKMKSYMARLPEEGALNPSTFFNMGINAYNASEMQKAADFFDQALEQSPDMAEGYYYRGLARINLGDNAGAKSDLETFRSMKPDDPKQSEVATFLEFLTEATADQ